MAKLFSLTGVDGSGKTTLIDRISRKTFTQKVQTLRVPQYFESVQDEYSAGIELLENIGKWADESKCATLKANATYLQFCLFGKTIKNIHKNSDVIISERHPLIDSLAFAKFYYHALKSEDQKINLEEIFFQKFTKKQLDQVNSLTNYELFNVHQRMINILELDFKTLLENLIQDFEVNLPDKLVILSASEELLSNRLEMSSKIREAHEQIGVLLLMQNALIQYGNLFKTNCEVLVQSVDGLDEEHLTSNILAFYNIT